MALFMEKYNFISSKMEIIQTKNHGCQHKILVDLLEAWKDASPYLNKTMHCGDESSKKS